MKKILLVFICLVIVRPLWGCDVNLVALVSGENPDKNFVAMVMKLAEQTRDVGQSLGKPGESKGKLATLMKTWVSFDNRYSQTPPEWARSDKDWSKKIASMASLIGNIFKEINSTSEEANVHRYILSLTSNLMELFDSMPLSEAKARLRDIFKGIAHLTESVELDDYKSFSSGLVSVSNNLEALKKSLATDTRSLINDFAFRLDQTQKLYNYSPGTFSAQLRFSVLLTEESLKEMNAQLAKCLK